MTKKWPRLFKKTSTGKIQEWDLEVRDAKIVTTYGLEGGARQTTTDVIREGKNLGKANETTPEEQALAEAESRWTLKRTKNRYVESRERALEGETDAVGGLAPMLAKSFAKDGKKAKFPGCAQPKLDGIRCVAVVDDGEVTLWTRTQKPIEMPHVAAAVAELLPRGQHVLDGELYNHDLRADFERIVSAVRGGKSADVASIQYHVYDYPSVDAGFAERSEALATVFDRVEPMMGATLVFVETQDVDDEGELMTCFATWRSEGYEGAMFRNAAGSYAEGKRSADLLKVKEFDDSEFKIVDVEEGRGKLAGHVGAFVCETKAGERFNAKMMGELSNLRRIYEGPEKAWRGKMLTVRYQGMTSGDVPRFPVGVAIRDYE